MVALKSTRALSDVLAGKCGVDLRESRLGSTGAAQEGFGQCGEGGHGRDFRHLWVSLKAESSAFLLKELEPFPRIF